MTSLKVNGCGYRQEPPLISWTGTRENPMMLVGRIVWRYLNTETAKNLGMISHAKVH